MNGIQVRRRGAVLAGVALAASILLSGCAGGFFGEDSGQSGGGTGGNGQSGTSGDGPEITDPGTAPDPVTQAEAIPADFPSEITLVDAEVTYGLSMGGGWTVVFAVEDAEAAYTEQSALLLAAGFTSAGEARSDAGSAGSYDSADYTLQMTSSISPDPTLLVVVQTKN